MSEAVEGKPKGVRRGLVLGAGGVLGAAWTIGALRALEEECGWDAREAEVLIGTSAGSVIAGMLGSGISAETLINHQRGERAEADPRIEFDYDTAHLPPRPRMRLGSRALLSATVRHPRRVTPMTALAAILPQGRGSLEPLGELISAVAPDGAWATHPRTWIVAMDYDTGKRVPFGREGAPPASLSEAVMASCAIPAWYAPVTINGRRYVDGGSCSPTSLDLVAPLGLDEVVVLAPMVSFEFDHPDSIPARLERRLRHALARRLVREAAKVQRAGGTNVVLLGPGAEDLAAIGANLMDSRRRGAVLETSMRTSVAALRRAQPGLAKAG